MARRKQSLDPARLLYGPPLPLRRGRPENGPWGAGFLPDVGGRSYVVVEEVMDEEVGIVISPWPSVHPGGRLRFAPEKERRQVAVARPPFQRRLASRRVIAYDLTAEERVAMRRRELSVGDVFAIEIRWPSGSRDLRTVGDSWIRGQAIDVTAMAREAAKASMLAALTGRPLSDSDITEIVEPDERPEPPAAGRRGR